jgi:hypothetical protein
MLLFWGGASQGFLQLDTLIVSEFDKLFYLRNGQFCNEFFLDCAFHMKTVCLPENDMGSSKN